MIDEYYFHVIASTLYLNEEYYDKDGNRLTAVKPHFVSSEWHVRALSTNDVTFTSVSDGGVSMTTDMNVGRCWARRATAARIGSNEASAFGGNTSKETDGFPDARISLIFMGTLVYLFSRGVSKPIFSNGIGLKPGIFL